MITLSKVGAEAIPAIKNLANIIWPATYLEILTAQQVDYMMELIYSSAALKAQMAKGHQFILAQEGEEPVAFASYAAKENNPSVYHLHKLYILPNKQGKGIGKQLLAYIKKDIAPASTLQLNVNRHNKALQFYQKIGFKIILEEDIPIGNDFYMNDYIMEMKW